MSFIGSDIYYSICTIALVLLLILLMELLDKNKRTPKKAPPPRYQEPKPTARQPRYAAGDDMDRINRNAYCVEFEDKHSNAPAIIGITIIGLLLLATLPKLSNESQQQTSTPPKSITAAAPAQLEPAGTIDMKLVSADLSDDLSKIFVTYRYTNNSDWDCHSLVPTINLLDAESNTIQTTIADTIDQIASGETKEIISAVEIQPGNFEKIKQITINTSYKG